MIDFCFYYASNWIKLASVYFLFYNIVQVNSGVFSHGVEHGRLVFQKFLRTIELRDVAVAHDDDAIVVLKKKQDSIFDFIIL